jgi:hypothetical protein
VSLGWVTEHDLCSLLHALLKPQARSCPWKSSDSTSADADAASDRRSGTKRTDAAADDADPAEEGDLDSAAADGAATLAETDMDSASVQDEVRSYALAYGRTTARIPAAVSVAEIAGPFAGEDHSRDEKEHLHQFGWTLMGQRLRDSGWEQQEKDVWARHLNGVEVDSLELHQRPGLASSSL